MRALVLAAAALLGAGVAAPARAGPPPTVAASLDTTSTSVGGRVHLRLEVGGADGWVVAPPAPSAELGSFRVRSVSSATTPSGAPAFTLALVATEVGDVDVPAVTLQARHGTDPPIEIRSSPVRVHVASNLGTPTSPPDSAGGSPAAPKPADLKPAIVPPRDWRPVWIALGAAALAFAAAWALRRRLRRRVVRKVEPVAVPKAPPRPAWEVALEELDRIVAERLVERGELRRQYESVTEALRRYLENRWGVPALESTTDDVRRLLADAPVSPAFAGRVTALLGEADLVKFAKGRPEPHAARAAETRARELVVETIPREEPKEAAA
jgi:hypothetical protein